MYSDIIPPKKKYARTRTEEYNSVRFSSPHPTYTQPRETKKPIILFLAACIVIGVLVYHNLSHTTKIRIAPTVTRFDIKRNIPLVLQGREDKSLTYSLVYVPESTGTNPRNPFSPSVATTTSSTTSLAKVSGAVQTTITASTTGDTKSITIINTTGGAVPLRKDTRFDVGGIVYTLDGAYANPPTEKKTIDKAKLVASSSVYKVIGFKGYATYDSIYAVPEISDIQNNTASVTATTTKGAIVYPATSTVPPKDLLSLMPAGTLALQKSTVYDKLLGQSALVVFEQIALESFLRDHIAETQEYYKALKPFGESISYDISILDYTVVTSPDSGKPTSLSSLSVEITPKIDALVLPLQFAGFSKDTMGVIEKQVSRYVELTTSYTPFWSKTVAEAEKIHIDMR